MVCCSFISKYLFMKLALTMALVCDWKILTTTRNIRETKRNSWRMIKKSLMTSMKKITNSNVICPYIVHT